MISTRGRTPEQWDERKKDVGAYVWAARSNSGRRPPRADHALTADQIASIGDWSDLRLRFEVTAS
jgi:hypothetical protein